MASSIPWLVQVGPAMPLRWQILWTNAPGAPLHKADGFAIETQNLRKVYGKKVAVRNLSLSVRCGEIFGFLGPNGPGKSTSIKMLLGLVKPPDGQTLVTFLRSEEHTSELQSHHDLVCRLLLEKKKKKKQNHKKKKNK